MKHLLHWIPVLLVLLVITMTVAHIGSSWLRTAVIVVAVALAFADQRKPRAAGRH